MRILYVGYAGSPSGGTRILAEHLNRLADRGHDCTLMFIVRGPVIDWMPIRFNQAIAQATPRNELIPVLDEFDVVVATEFNTWPLVAEYLNFPNARRRMAFMQMREHLFFPHGDQRWAKFLGYYEHLLVLEPIVISQWLYDWAKIHSLVDPIIVPNGVNTDMFYPDAFEVPKDKLRILIEGHSNNQAKDVASMSYRAASWLRNQGVDFELWGFSQYPQPFEYDRYWRLPDQDTIRRIYSSCDILLKASKYEGRSCVDAEAMACGCAVNRAILAGDDDLQHGFNCLKTVYGNQHQFQQNLLSMAQDAVIRATLRDNGMYCVREWFDWDKIIPQLESALGGEK